MGALDGKGALVTGGSRGIGRATVKRLAAEGAAVVFSYLQNEAAAADVVREVTEDCGRAVAVRADQGSLDDLRRLARQADEHLDGLDIVVINAAGCPVVPIDKMTEDAYDQYMAVHAKGPFFLIQHAGRALRDGGRIIAISTLNTRLHPPGGALYTGAKGALENFTKVAAIEFGRRGITANVVSPGATDTEMLRAANPGETFEVGALRITPHLLMHPIPTFGYRIDEGTTRFSFATDNEIALFANGANGTLKDLANWCRDSDLLVHDAQYSEEEYKTHTGFGHSTYQEALSLAEQAGVKELAFFHHDPLHSDTDVDALIEQALGNHRASGGADVNSFPAAEEQELAL